MTSYFVPDCPCSDCRDERNRIRASSSSAVHATRFISSCDVQLLCTGVWTLPNDSSDPSSDPDVLTSEDYFRYTKDVEKVTCAQCLQRLNRS